MSRSLLVLCVGVGALSQGACAYDVIDREQAEADVAVTDAPLFVKSSNLWPQGKPIPVCWQAPSPNQARERGWVEDAVTRSWEAASNVRFAGWGECASTSTGIRIRVADESAAANTKAMGTSLNGIVDGMSLNFTFNNWSISCSFTAAERERCIRAVAVHEFGHALAFAHEQNRQDTDRTTCTDEPQGPDGDTSFAPWDLSSVMNYCNPDWNNGGVLSASDMAGARALYGTRKIAGLARRSAPALRA